MQLAQRSDGDGSGFQIIWRDGSRADSDPDHRIKFLSGGPNYNTSQVFHFKLTWNGSGYDISVNGVSYLSYGWCCPFTPSPMKISFGCYPRNETFVGMVVRNVKLTPQ